MAAHLNEKEVENLKKQFLALDEDGSGLVTIEELKGIFKDPRLKMSEEDVEVLLGEFFDFLMELLRIWRLGHPKDD